MQGCQSSRPLLVALKTQLALWSWMVVSGMALAQNQPSLLTSNSMEGASPKVVIESTSPTFFESLPDQRLGFFEVIRQSITNPRNPDEWTPLYLSNLSEGFDQPWIAVPNGSSGAPRQGWLNTFDGFFTREYHLGYFYREGTKGDTDIHTGLYQFQTPLSRRVWIGIDVPIQSFQGGPANRNDTEFGDLFFTSRVMLQETRDLSLSGGVTVRTPTGKADMGNDQTSILPFLALWTDVGAGISVRGGLGVDISVDRSSSVGSRPDNVFFANLSIGQTITPNSAVPFGDFTYYAAMNVLQGFGKGDPTLVTILPGIRTHLGRNLFLLAGYDFPLTGPKPFDSRLSILFVKGF